MSLTEAMRKRFWSAMGERFGKRWLEEYGQEPTKAWSDLLERYSPDDIAGALHAMGSKGWQHPPTLPQFEPLLVAAASQTARAQIDYTRGYWRSVVISTLEVEGVLMGLWPRGRCAADLQGRLRDLVLLDARRLIDEAHDAERRTGQRTLGIEDAVKHGCRDSIAAIKAMLPELQAA